MVMLSLWIVLAEAWWSICLCEPGQRVILSAGIGSKAARYWLVARLPSLSQCWGQACGHLTAAATSMHGHTWDTLPALLHYSTLYSRHVPLQTFDQRGCFSHRHFTLYCSKRQGLWKRTSLELNAQLAEVVERFSRYFHTNITIKWLN